MKSNKLIITIFIILSLPNCNKKSDQISAGGAEDRAISDVKKMSYAEFAEADMIGASPQRIKSMLGEPNIINNSNNRVSWSYGPDIDVVISGEPGSIIGVTVSFDTNFKVINVSPSRKTQEIKYTE
jgi:hypothetical protein